MKDERLAKVWFIEGMKCMKRILNYFYKIVQCMIIKDKNNFLNLNIITDTLKIILYLMGSQCKGKSDMAV